LRLVWDATQPQKLSRGRLTALRPTTDKNGSSLQYSGVGEDTWRRFSSSGAAWSFYRDNIEEEFAAKRVSAQVPVGKNPLEELFGCD
jgi:hypothetical protein